MIYSPFDSVFLFFFQEGFDQAFIEEAIFGRLKDDNRDVVMSALSSLEVSVSFGMQDFTWSQMCVCLDCILCSCLSCPCVLIALLLSFNRLKQHKYRRLLLFAISQIVTKSLLPDPYHGVGS